MPAGLKAQEKEEETTMLKTISAALVAVSVLAAPALAGATGKTAQAPVNKITQAPVIKADGKSKALNANARMDRHHNAPCECQTSPRAICFANGRGLARAQLFESQVSR
jgi:hypothetical protein